MEILILKLLKRAFLKLNSIEIPESTGRSKILDSILDIENKINGKLNKILRQFQNKMSSSLIDFLKKIMYLDDEHFELCQKLNLVKFIHYIDATKRPTNKIVEEISFSAVKNSKIATEI